MGLHRNSTGNDVHVIYTFTYVNATARNFAVGLVATDVGKVARQTSDETYWILIDNSPVTWTQISASTPGATVYDLLLETDIPDPDNNYSNTRVSGKVVQEKWERDFDSTKIKIIDYTYTGSRLTTEIRKIYASDGTTIVAQLTINYAYTGSTLISQTVTRDV